MINIEKTISFIDELEGILNPFIKQSEDIQEMEYPVPFIYHCYLERLYNGLLSIKGLLPLVKANLHHETSIGIILRQMLLDTLYISYWSLLKSTDKPKLLNNINSFLYDHINRSKSYADKMFGLGLVDRKENELIKNNISSYENLLNTDLEKDVISPLAIVKALAGVPNYERMINAYHIYDYYSKYEHFGVLTYFMQRTNTSDDLKRIKQSVAYSAIGLGLISDMLQFKDAEQILPLLKKYDMLI